MKKKSKRTTNAKRSDDRVKKIDKWTIYGGIEAVDVDLPNGKKRSVMIIRQYVVFSERDARLLAKKFGPCHATQSTSGRILKTLHLGHAKVTPIGARS